MLKKVYLTVLLAVVTIFVIGCAADNSNTEDLEQDIAILQEELEELNVELENLQSEEPEPGLEDAQPEQIHYTVEEIITLWLGLEQWFEDLMGEPFTRSAGNDMLMIGQSEILGFPLDRPVFVEGRIDIFMNVVTMACPNDEEMFFMGLWGGAEYPGDSYDGEIVEVIGIFTIDAGFAHFNALEVHQIITD
jgi:hypothetical protein